MVHIAQMVHDGGGAPSARFPANPPPQPAADVRSYQAVGGETVDSLAQQYGVSPEALIAANPRLGQVSAYGGSPIQAGDELQIPASPQSVTEDDIATGSANHSTTSVSVTGKADDGTITWKPNSLSVKLTEKQEIELGSSRPEGAGKDVRGASVSLSDERSVTVTASSTADSTSFSVKAQTQVKLSGEAGIGGKKGGGEISASVSGGFESSFKVTLPGQVSQEQAALVDPFDPTTLPVGGSVTLDSQAFEGTSLEGAFRHIAVKTDIKESEGVSYRLERVDENTVRVTTGPTETINAFNGAGVKVGDLSVLVGREDQLHGASLQTAEFDISTVEGQSALQHFNTTGQIAHTTPGVDNVATIDRIDFSSQTQLRASLGDVSLTLGGQANLGSSVRVTYPDGSMSLTTDLSYGGNVPLTIEQRFDADGNELPGERSYQFEVTTDRPSYNWFERNILGRNEASEEQANADLLNWALSGNAGGSGPVAAGDTVTLSFSESQLQTLMDQTRATVESNEIGGAYSDLRIMVEDYNGNPVTDTTGFALSLARNIGSDPYGFAERLQTISAGADGDVTNHNYAAIDADVRIG